MNIKIVGLAVFFCFASEVCANQKPLRQATSRESSTKQDKPNIVIILNDDMGYADIGCFGSETNETPRIDKLANEGRRFTDFYVASSVCSASRAALMTGRYPSEVGVPGVFFPNRGAGGLAPEHFTIAELLKSAGYKTMAAGKWHLGDKPQYLPTNQGFDSYFGIPYSNDMYPAKSMKYADECIFLDGITPAKIKAAFVGTPEGKQPKMKNMVPLMRDEECIEFPLDQTTITRRLADESIHFIEESVRIEKPFFLYLANPMPHIPLFVSPEFEGKTGHGLYSDVIAEIDHNTGRVLDALKSSGVDKNTLVIFSSDNGPWLLFGDEGGSAQPLRDGKASTYEGGQRVPTIMRWPAKIPAGTVSSELATTMDMMPTFAAITEAKLPVDLPLDGHNMLGLMTGGADAKTPYRAFYYQEQAVRSGEWKYRAGPRHGQWSTPRGQPKPKENPKENQLFNLAKDIGESNNVIDQYPEVASRLIQLIAENRIKKQSAQKQSGPPASATTALGLRLLECRPPEGMRYEAESGKLSGGAIAGPSPSASSGVRVKNLHRTDAAIKFKVDGGAKGGAYDFVLAYGSPKGAGLTLQVNGFQQLASLPKTGGWNDYKAVQLNVNLKPGADNQVLIKVHGANLDYFDLDEL